MTTPSPAPSRPTSPRNPLVASLVRRLSTDLRDDYEERAAIMEFDGSLTREHAEALALLDVIHRHPDALLGLSMLRVIQRGKVRFVITKNAESTRRALLSVGCHVSLPLPLQQTFQHAFNGWAWLSGD